MNEEIATADAVTPLAGPPGSEDVIDVEGLDTLTGHGGRQDGGEAALDPIVPREDGVKEPHPEPKLQSLVTQDNVSSPGEQHTITGDGSVSVHDYDAEIEAASQREIEERDAVVPLAEDFDPEAE